MASNRKQYELIMQLKASSASGFQGTFKTASQNIKDLQTKIKDLRKEQSDISAYQKTQGSVEALKKRKEELAASSVENTKEIKTLNSQIIKEEQKLSDLNTQLRNSGIDTGNLTARNKELADEYDNLKKKQEGIANFDNWQSKNSEKLKEAQRDFAKTSAVVAGMGVAFYKGAIEPAIDFESAFAGVKKTVDGTPQELAELQKEIRDFSRYLPSTANEIAAVAESAGQLGIENKNIMEFSKTMLDLGESTNMTAEEAATQLAQFANITKMSQGDFDELGSVIVRLGNNFATTEADIVEMSMRLAGAGSQVGMTQAEIMGFSAALSSVGIKAEMGGSAFSKTMVNMQAASEVGMGKAQEAIDATGKSLEELEWLKGTDSEGFKALAESIGYTRDELGNFVGSRRNLEDFANVAGVSAGEFAAQFKNDASGAITDFITGLSNMDEEGMSAIVTLEEMGLTEQRLRDTLLKAANANEVFSKAQEMANDEWVANNALTHEAEQRYETTQSKLDIMKNSFTDVGISLGETFLPNIKETVGNIAEVANRTSDWIQKNPGLTKQMVELAGKTALFIVGLKGLSVAKLAASKQIGGFIAMSKGVAPAAGTIAKGLVALGPAGIAAGIAVAGVTVALELNKKRLRELQEEYGHKLLFDNGGVKLSELTDKLIENNSGMLDHAKAVNASKEKLAELRDEIKNARNDLDFYELDSISQEDAAEMYEPFNRLATALEDDFQIRYNNVFDAFKIAAMGASENLGGAITEISGSLDAFKASYAENLGEARSTINAHLERVQNGEEISAEDWDNYNREMALIRDLESVGSKREYEDAKAGTANIDFENPEQAKAEITRLKEFAVTYQQELADAQKIINDEISNSRGIALVLLEHGEITKEQYENTINALAATYTLSNESYIEAASKVESEIKELGQGILDQVQDKKNGMRDNFKYGDELGAEWRADLKGGIFKKGDERLDMIQKVLYGEVHEVHKEAKELMESLDRPKIEFDAVLSKEGQNYINELMSGSLVNISNVVSTPKKGSSVDISNVVSTPKKGSSVDIVPYTKRKSILDGSAADGLDYVPFDGYISELHKGERVLTAAENREFSNSPLSISEPYSLRHSPSVRGALGSGGTTVSFGAGAYSPVININGNAPDDLEGILKRHGEQLIAMVKNSLREDKENERRMAY